MTKSDSINANPVNPMSFDDSGDYLRYQCQFPCKIYISYGDAIDNIQLVYPGGITLEKHGHAQGGGQNKSLNLEPDERIIGIEAKTGDYKGNHFLFGLTFRTTKSIKRFIVNSSTSMVTNLREKKIDFEPGTAMACIYGSTARANDDPFSDGYLSCIGAYTIPIKNDKVKKNGESIDAMPTEPHLFDDFPDYQSESCKYPSEIRIGYGAAIDNIQVVYPQDVEMDTHGNMGGEHFKSFTFSPCERIVGLKAMVGTYKGNRFIYDLSFKLASNWKYVGLSNNPGGYTDIREIIVDFPYNYCLGCIAGKTAETQDELFSEYLSALELYILPIELESSKLYWYSQNVQKISKLSHTGAYTDGDYSYFFGCNGTLPLKKDPEYYDMDVSDGNTVLARIIATGEIYTARDNGEYTDYDSVEGKSYGRDNCGIRYGRDGVCHQMANRLLYACERGPATLGSEHVKGCKLSYRLFGIYGGNWEEWRQMCLEKYQGMNQISNPLKTPAFIMADEFTGKILEIDNSPGLTEEEKIEKRFRIGLEDSGRNDLLTDIIHRFAENHVSYINMDAANDGNSENDIETEEKIDLNIQEFLEKCHAILGDSEFEKEFGFTYYPQFKLSDF